MTNKEGYKEPTAEQAIGSADKKKKNPMDRIGRAIADLMAFYLKAKDNDRIRNPEAWALYQTWKKYDGRY